jgi:Ser/Thr protein kinase RdoA (MazF antagonist)
LTSAFHDWPLERQMLALQRLAQEALKAYDGAFSPPELVKYRENAIFSVRRHCGSRFALRIHRSGYHSDAALASELIWMQALARTGIEVPEVVRTREGETHVWAADAAMPEKRQVDLLVWLEGDPLSEIEARGSLGLEERRALYADVGALAARLHNQAATWSPPTGFARHDWYAEALLGDAPLWGRFWELDGLTPPQVALLKQVRERAFGDLAGYGASSEYSGLIHADLVPDNVLVNGTRLHPIDFDDAGFGWHMFDLATILYFTLDDGDHAALRRAVLDGYRSVRPLPDRDEERMPLFLLVRGLTYLGWVHTRRETATARELTPTLIERCCDLAAEYV